MTDKQFESIRDDVLLFTLTVVSSVVALAGFIASLN